MARGGPRRLTRRAIFMAPVGMGGCSLLPDDPARTYFDEIAGRVVLDVRIAGSPARALLDNASWSMLDSGFAASAAMASRSGRASVVSNGQAGERLFGLNAEVAGQTVRLDPMLADVTEWHSGVNAIVGYEAFERWVVGLDFDDCVLSLFDRRTFRRPQHATPVHLRRSAEEKWTVQLDIAGVKVAALVDLGANSALCLSTPLATRLGLEVVGGSRWNHLHGPDMDVGWATTPSVHIANLELRNVTTDIFPVNPPQQWRWDAVLGAPALSRFQTYFDLPRDRLWLSPGKRYSRPFLSGRLGGIAAPASRGWHRLVEVSPGGPADLAGLSKGDLIRLTVDQAADSPALTVELQNGRLLRIPGAGYSDRY